MLMEPLGEMAPTDEAPSPPSLFSRISAGAAKEGSMAARAGARVTADPTTTAAAPRPRMIGQMFDCGRGAGSGVRTSGADVCPPLAWRGARRCC